MISGKPKDRAATLRGRIAALSLHAQGKTNTAPARDAFNRRFEHEVDPDGTLPEVERLRRAELAKKAHFTRLALKSSKARAGRSRA